MLKRPTRTRLATDEITIDDDAMEMAIAFLQTKLSPADLSHLKTMLADEQADDSEDDDNKAKDSGPAPFKGMPQPGGKMVASDSRGDTFADRWPEVARIRHGY